MVKKGHLLVVVCGTLATASIFLGMNSNAVDIIMERGGWIPVWRLP